MLKGWKTVLFNVAMGAVMLIRAINPGEEVVVDEAQVTAAVDSVEVAVNYVTAALTAVWAIGNIWLRAITTSPIFSKV